MTTTPASSAPTSSNAPTFSNAEAGNNPASHSTAHSTAPNDNVLDVPTDEQIAYVEASYRDYLLHWRGLRLGLETARRSGDHTAETRLIREIRALWPRPEAVARAAGVMKRAY